MPDLIINATIDEWPLEVEVAPDIWAEYGPADHVFVSGTRTFPRPTVITPYVEVHAVIDPEGAQEFELVNQGNVDDQLFVPAGGTIKVDFTIRRR